MRTIYENGLVLSLSFSLEDSLVCGMRFKDVVQEVLGPGSADGSGSAAFQRTSVDSQTTKMWNKTPDIPARNTGQGSLEGYSWPILQSGKTQPPSTLQTHAFFFLLTRNVSFYFHNSTHAQITYVPYMVRSSLDAICFSRHVAKILQIAASYIKLYITHAYYCTQHTIVAMMLT